MKRIVKLPEPNSLVQHRAGPHSFYHNIPTDAREDLKANLLLEQGYLCCYCLKRIPEKVDKDGVVSYEMKVEHHQSQDSFEHLQLQYINLFGACTGNEGKPNKLQTCDTKKGSNDITINLVSNAPDCETLFKYNADGEMSSFDDNEDVNRQINDTLNLNMQSLKDARREVYLEVQKRVETESRRLGNKNLKLRFFEQERDNWLARTENKHKPYCMIAVYYLKKKIRQNQSA